jgi:PEP-CTERM motif
MGDYMRKMSIFVLLIVALLLATASAKAGSKTVVTFDDLSGQALVPNGYGGINWNGNWTYYGFSQPPFNPESAPNRVYDLPGGGNSFNFVTPHVFDGAYFAGISAATVTFELFNGVTLVATSGTLAPSGTPTFLASGYSGLVTSVEVISPGPDEFVMDNVTYGTGTSATPEPSTFLLFGTGLLGSLGMLRRKLVS